MKKDWKRFRASYFESFLSGSFLFFSQLFFFSSHREKIKLDNSITKPVNLLFIKNISEQSARFYQTSPNWTNFSSIQTLPGKTTKVRYLMPTEESQRNTLDQRPHRTCCCLAYPSTLSLGMPTVPKTRTCQTVTSRLLHTNCQKKNLPVPGMTLDFIVWTQQFSHLIRVPTDVDRRLPSSLHKETEPRNHVQHPATLLGLILLRRVSRT